MKLSNNVISIEVDPHGAELVSLVRKGREYMWNGDAKFWNRRAPILFPAVGKPYNNEIRIDGKVYPMKQHGFARDCEFEEAGEGLLVMKDVRPENYPYRFALEAQYKLDGNRVDITWTVVNLDKRDLYAQIGAQTPATGPSAPSSSPTWRTATACPGRSPSIFRRKCRSRTRPSRTTP